MTLLRTPSLTLLAGVVFSVSLHAQDITGDWHGLSDDVGLRLSIHVRAEDGRYAATMDSPDQGAFGIPLDAFTLEGRAVAFQLAAAGFTYAGNVDPGFTQIVGSFRQAEREFALRLGRDPILPPAGSPQWLADRLTKREVYITMRDGKRLFTSFYVPKDTTRTYPIVLMRTPYDIEPRGENGFSPSLGGHTHLVEAGYILAYQDVRGRYMSEGTFMDVRPYVADKQGPQDIDEASDTYDTIDWLVNNVPHNNGRVGVFGISYPGFYSTMSLLDAHSALKAVSPQAPVTNWFLGDDWHHHGAFFLLDAFTFFARNGQVRSELTRRPQRPFAWPSVDNYDFFLDLGTVKRARETYLQDIGFWPELMAHPNYDDFWKARDPRPHLTDVRPAVLTVGGWFDAEDLFGPLNLYASIEGQNPATLDNRIVMGPWSHGQWASGPAGNLGNVYWGRDTGPDFKALELRFFDAYLKGDGTSDLPEASIFLTGANRWASFETWPPDNTAERRLFLMPDGGLGFSPPTATASFDELVADPNRPVPYTEDVHVRRTTEYMLDDQRFASRRPDVFVYESAHLTENMTLTGPLVADLWVSTTGTDSDFVVKLIDVFPDTLQNYPANEKNVPMAGYQMLVRGEVFRGRFRHSYEHPEPFTPGEIARVRFELPDIAHTFKRGHRLMVQVQHSWFPLVDRNPQTFVDIYHADESDFQKATQRLYHDVEHPSSLQVRVLQE